MEDPASAGAWFAESNSLIILAVPDEAALYDLAARLRARGLCFVSFEEPDLGHELTALALRPCPEAARACSSLPLALRRVDDQAPAQARERAWRAAVAEMEGCEQAPGQDLLAHGLAVRDHLRSLVALLAGAGPLEGAIAPSGIGWRLPAWVAVHRQSLVAELASARVMDRYTTMHDCGKARADRARQPDDPRRFPDHAAHSAAVWAGLGGDPEVGALIAADMDLHTLAPAEVAGFAARAQAPVLLVAGLAELHANAGLFGGTDSTSFKIKSKFLERRGRAVCALRWG